MVYLTLFVNVLGVKARNILHLTLQTGTPLPPLTSSPVYHLYCTEILQIHKMCIYIIINFCLPLKTFSLNSKVT